MIHGELVRPGPAQRPVDLDKHRHERRAAIFAEPMRRNRLGPPGFIWSRGQCFLIAARRPWLRRRSHMMYG
jgi:hypothetical protein